MKLEYLKDDSVVSVDCFCGARMFRFENPPRFLCLREAEHAKYVKGNALGDNHKGFPWHERGSNENNLRAASWLVPDLRDGALFCADDVDMPE